MDHSSSSAQSAAASRIASYAAGIVFDSIDRHYNWFLEKLKKEEKVRIIVGSASGSGHQSQAVLMLRLITDIWGKADPENKGKKTVQLIYDTVNDLNKITVTEPKLNDDSPIINGIQVNVVRFDERSSSLEDFKYGFTGAYDDPNNIAEKYKVKYFLKLQPLFWRHMDEIHCYESEYVYSEGVSVLLEKQSITHLINYKVETMSTGKPETIPKLKVLEVLQDFRCLGYSNQLPQTPQWTKGDEKNIKAILDRVNPNNLDLCVTYSIGKGSVFTNSTAEILFNLASGFAFAKEQKNIDSNHIVILNFTGEMDQDEVKMASLMLLSGEEYSSAIKESSISDNLKKRIQDAKNLAQISDYQMVFHVLSISEQTEFEEILSAQDNLHIILVNIPSRQSKEVFDFCLSKVTLFSLFEGSGTASVAATIGLPYLKFNSTFEIDQTPHYLYSPLGDQDLKLDMAISCQKTANCLAFKFSDWNNKDPKNLPPNLISQFIKDCKNGGELDRYFKATKAIYQDEKKTRIYIGFAIFNMLIENERFRGNDNQETPSE